MTTATNPHADAAETGFEETARFLLTVGRLLRAGGADTEQIAGTVGHLAHELDFEARRIVAYEAPLLTLVRDRRFRTRAGRRLPGFGVNMRSVGAIGRIVDDLTAGRTTLPRAEERL